MRARDRWAIDIAARTARLGAVTAHFIEQGSGAFTLSLEGADELNLRARLNLVWQASEAFDNAMAKSRLN